MVDQCVDILVTAVSSAADWFIALIDKTEAAPFYLGCLIAYIAVRFFISNIMKTRAPGGWATGSDYARSKDSYNEKDETSEG